jgi:hypothetical protein
MSIRPSAGMGPTLPPSRLPKQFWRVVVKDTQGKLRTYDRASKTYADVKHAQSAVAGFTQAGIEAEIWTTGPVEWTKV